MDQNHSRAGVANAVTLAGAPNFRDLGGYATADGRRVRRGLVFRSDHLGALTAADLATLAQGYGPQWRVLDLRGEQERLAAPCVLPQAEVHALSIEPTVVQKLGALLAAGHAPGVDETVALMQDTYVGFVRGNSHRFAAFFSHLLEDDARPLVFHCTAGKDRTGFAAALLLHALGVPAPTIWSDYLLTNARLGPRVVPPTLPPAIAHVLHRVQVDFLQAALDAVAQDFGGLDAYLQGPLGLDAAARARLCARLLD